MEHCRNIQIGLLLVVVIRFVVAGNTLAAERIGGLTLNDPDIIVLEDGVARKAVGFGISFDAKSKEGALLTKIFPGSMAEKAGLTIGEYIISIEGKNCVGIHDPKLIVKMLNAKNGKPVELEVLNESGQKRKLSIGTGEFLFHLKVQ
jgi:C-terminal processing protease CtpA/Prc